MAGETPTRQPGHTGAKRLHAVSKLQKSRPPHLEDGFSMGMGCGVSAQRGAVGCRIVGFVLQGVARSNAVR